MDTWDLLKKIYKEQLNIDPEIIEYIATYDILKLCVRGKSVSSISVELNEEPFYIVSVLYDIFGFKGFEKDLDFDSRSLYIKYKFSPYAYLSTARLLDRQVNSSTLSQSFRINKLFDLIEREVIRYDYNA